MKRLPLATPLVGQLVESHLIEVDLSFEKHAVAVAAARAGDREHTRFASFTVHGQVEPTLVHANGMRGLQKHLELDDFSAQFSNKSSESQ